MSDPNVETATTTDTSDTPTLPKIVRIVSAAMSGEDAIVETGAT